VGSEARYVTVFAGGRDAGHRYHAAWKAGGLLIGLESEDDWFDYRLETDPRFLARVDEARASLGAGQGVRLDDIPED
jgi:hypothetical protein